MRKSILPFICLAKRYWKRLPRAERKDPTVAEGWELYARNYEGEGHLGDEWNRPDKQGIDADPTVMLRRLDEEIFSPYLGHCDTLLEIGPGGGRFTEYLLPKCERLIAVETSPSMLGLLRRRFQTSQHKIVFCLTDGTGFKEVPASSVDCVFSYGVFVHLQPWDVFNYLKEISRVLRVGGRVIIQHPNTFSELGWRKFLADLPANVNSHKTPQSFSLMTPQVMEELVSRAGLKTVECITDSDLVKRDSISKIRK